MYIHNTEKYIKNEINELETKVQLMKRKIELLNEIKDIDKTLNNLL